jgi:hypothetical protein
MINTIRTEYDHLLTPPFLVKKDDPGVPTIECTINQKILHKTFCDMGSGVNIMSKVIYEYLFGNEPLYPSHVQLQMVDHSFRFVDGIARDVMVKIQDHFVPADFMVLDMGDEEEDTPIILGRSFLNTIDAIIYIGSGQIHFQFSDRKVRCHFNSYTNHEQPKKPRNNRRRRRSCHQANQPLKDGWADYPREVSRYEDHYGDQDDKVEKNKVETVKEPR